MDEDIGTHHHSPDLTEREKDGGIKFSPPLYEQRYMRAYQILLHENVVSLADVGCAECKSLRLFKDLPLLERMLGVDIDARLLREHHWRLVPLIAHYLHRRPRPLAIQLLAGNLLHWDARMRNLDAVTMIEVIEHLTLDDVSKLPEALFGRARPRLVVMTTPNADYNVLFPQLVGFRHYDHKFEWTRRQFSDWCDDVASRYAYSVEYGGVGDPPPGSEHLGHCSQIATFRRLADDSATAVDIEDDTAEPYSLIFETEYPGETMVLSAEEKVLNEVQYYVGLVCRSENSSGSEGILLSDISGLSGESGSGGVEGLSQEEQSSLMAVYNDADSVFVIALSELMGFEKLQAACDNDVNYLREIMKSGGYILTADELSVIYPYNRGSRYGEHYDDSGAEFAEEEEESTSGVMVDRKEGDFGAVSVEEYWG